MKDNRLIDFTLVYNSHKKGLYNYLLKITRSTVLAEDILHNVFIKLYEHAVLIKDLNKVEFWLFNAARNEAISHLRRSKKLSTIEDESLASSSDEDLFALIETHEIRGVIMSELEKMDAAQIYAAACVIVLVSFILFREVSEMKSIISEKVERIELQQAQINSLIGSMPAVKVRASIQNPDLVRTTIQTGGAL